MKNPGSSTPGRNDQSAVLGDMNQTVGQSLAQQRVPAGAREGQGEDQSKELNINRDAGAFRPQVSISSYVSSPEAVELRCEGSQSFRMNGRARQDGSDGRTKCATDSRPLPLDVSREDSTSGNGDLRFHRTLSPLDQSTIPDGRSSHSILSSPSKSPSDMPPDDGPGSRSSYDILRSSSRSTGSSPAASSTRGKRTANRRPSRLMVSAFLSTAGAAEAGSISGNAESNTQQRELPVDENFIAQASHAEEEPVIAHMGKMRRLGEGNLSKRSLAPSLSIRRSSISNQNWLDGRSSALPLPGLSIATASFQRINAPFSRLDSLKDAGTPKRAESKRFLTLKSSKFKLEDGEASTSASPAAQRGTSQPSEQESRAASLVANVLSERSLSRQKSCTKSLKGQMQSRRLIQMMEGDSSSDEQEITENDTLSSEEKKAKMFAWMKHGTKTTRTLLASEARAKKEEDRQRKKEEEEAARQRRIQEEEEMRRKEEEEAAELLKQFEAGGAYKARKLSEAEAKWKERNVGGPFPVPFPSCTSAVCWLLMSVPQTDAWLLIFSPHRHLGYLWG